MPKRKSKEQRKRYLERLIKRHGSPYAAANHLGIKPQAFYERMERAGMKPEGYKPLPGEPEGKKAKKKWLINLLEANDNNVCRTAQKLNRSPSAIRSRMKTYGISSRQKSLTQRIREFKKVFYECGKDVSKMAKKLRVSKQAIYERIDRYGLQTPQQKVIVNNKIKHLKKMQQEITKELAELTA